MPCWPSAGATLTALGIERFDLMGEGAGATAAVRLALATQADIVGMSVPHRDDTPTVIARCPDHQDKTTPAKTRSASAKSRTSFGEYGPPLGFVPGVHELTYLQKSRGQRHC
jgi:hypothetical protein